MCVNHGFGEDAMPLGHLFVGVLGAATAFAATLLLGWSFWAALVAYIVVGNVVTLLSAVLGVARGRVSPERRRAPDYPTPVLGSSLVAVQTAAGSASRARPAMAAKASGS